VAIKRWVSFHGFALNYVTDLDYFQLIHPCGLEGVRMTSMGKLLGRKIDRKELMEKVRFHFRRTFERDWEERTLEEIINF
jgi:lipoate-protein ligase B